MVRSIYCHVYQSVDSTYSMLVLKEPTQDPLVEAGAWHCCQTVFLFQFLLGFERACVSLSAPTSSKSSSQGFVGCSDCFIVIPVAKEEPPAKRQRKENSYCQAEHAEERYCPEAAEMYQTDSSEALCMSKLRLAMKSDGDHISSRGAVL